MGRYIASGAQPIPRLLQLIRLKGSDFPSDEKTCQLHAPLLPSWRADDRNPFEVRAVADIEDGIGARRFAIPTLKGLVHIERHPDLSESLDQ